MPGAPWYATSYRRTLLDMHIDDRDATFLSRVDPAVYVDLLARAHVRSVMLYANSHVGLCYWPTRSGRMHRGLGGHDLFGDLVARCHAAGLAVVAYYSLVFHNVAYDEHPDWRMVDVDGRGARDHAGRGGRYGMVCPNVPAYRDFVAAQVGELLDGYAPDGVFFDMTFWPQVCHCAACRTRFACEVGGEMPAVIDWDDPAWVAFQSRREAWLAEFAHFATDLVHARVPAVSVEHNCAPLLGGRRLGGSRALVPANDYVGGDLYGGLREQSFVCKLYDDLTPHRPCEFMTSRAHPTLAEHTGMKPRALLETQVFLALAHHAAFQFIDAIDPVGTVDARVYETMGAIFRRSAPYEPYLEGERVEDVAVYVSLAATVEPGDNGKRSSTLGWLGGLVPHVKAAVGAATALAERHVPHGVTTTRGLARLERRQPIVVPAALRLDDDEVEALEAYVARGGALYVSGEATPRLRALAGVAIEGSTRGMSYVTPAPPHGALFPGVEPAHPLAVRTPQAIATARADTEVLATLTLPYTDPRDGTSFASIHSDPPGPTTDRPAVTRRRVGTGTVLWTAAVLEALDQPVAQDVFVALLRSLAPAAPSVEADAPPVVEVIAYREPARTLVHLVNLQATAAPLPVHDIRIRVRAPDVTGVVLLPDGVPLPCSIGDGQVEVAVPELATHALVGIRHGKTP